MDLLGVLRSLRPQAREFVWSAVATLKDLIDQTFERMGRLVKSEVVRFL